MVTCTVPAYLENHGVPANLEEMAGRKAINFLSGRNARLSGGVFCLLISSCYSAPCVCDKLRR